MDELLQRDDLIYKEIEEFEDYELTDCIAYEMMIRNTEFINDSLEINKILPIYYDVDGNKCINKNYNHDLFLRKLIEGTDKWGIDADSLINYINIPISNLLNGNYSIIYKKDSAQFLEEEINNSDFKCYKFIYSDLYYNISRPKIKEINNIKLTNIEFNLNLLKEELIAYISKIKDDFDKDNSIIKTPLELLGETLEKSDNKRTPKKPKAFVYADWFYIYDYWKYEKAQGKTDKDIFVALEVENNVPYKEDMIRKIRDKMKYFIDDLGYKELITGVKNS
ncbi:hypothetical protein [Aliarcobacter butzleri]|uniref:hypothetical protein n=1 Tax=Aliarcobacter butzleri TaxID=28197 RepID=UPI00189E509E|nr:hypothetical protein [Aliarcobacter butzleri]MBF7065003.1 hypothetical protein [Aliarcobacter butzleri]